MMKIVVLGLGYVGLPLAIELAKHFEVMGLDIDRSRIAELESGFDRTHEVDEPALSASTLRLTHDAADCRGADFYIVTVPTPIDDQNQPDLGPVISATRAVAAMIDPALKPIIIYESTVYPGVTEDICGPLLEAESGHRRSVDFFLGYSPERINPGDKEHVISRITKVIAGENPDITEKLAAVYGAITTGGVFRAKSIKAAEAAKVIENAQRDINIGFMNEITQIFNRLDLSIWDVLDAAGTKWNFLPFQPGLVGGHCIGVDPYYLSHQAQQLGCDPQVILSGRSVNDGMGSWLAEQIDGKLGQAASILVMGLTFKENVPDLRNSKVIDVIRALEAKGHKVIVHDPLADPAAAMHEYGVTLDSHALGRRYDAAVALVPHDQYRAMDKAAVQAMVHQGGLIVDLKRMWPNLAAHIGGPENRRYWAM
jgi:UDP-N-acetyl-D-glucosamine/UDP-N-acetyl-D-galactosamine dehydrogenase